MKLLIKFFSLLLEAQIFFRVPCSPTPLLGGSSFDMGDVYPHAYKTTCEIKALCIIIFIVLYSLSKEKIFLIEWQLAFPECNMFLSEM
jgi:hypothetical protein